MERKFSSTSRWGALGWWIVVVMSIPFAFYSAVFVIGNFEVYRQFTLTWRKGDRDVAGLNILHHLRAWQIHSAAAEVFISTGPFQLSPSFRAKFPTIHRVLGYVFVIAATVSSLSALLFLIPHTEFGPLARTVFTSQACLLLYVLFVAVKMAKEKNFQVHRRYMLRAAAIGYGTIVVRPFIFFSRKAGMSIPIAMEMSALTAPILTLGLAELYIRRVVLEPKVTITGHYHSKSIKNAQSNP